MPRAPSRGGLVSCISRYYTRYEYKMTPGASNVGATARRVRAADGAVAAARSSRAWGLHRRPDPPGCRESDHAPVCRLVLPLPLPLRQGDEGSVETGLPVGVHACAIGSLRLESIGWIVCQPKTLTVLVPRNPLLEPSTFRAEPEARRLGRGRGGSQDVGLAPVRARKDGHGG